MEKNRDFLTNITEMLDKGKWQDGNHGFMVPRTNLFTFLLLLINFILRKVLDLQKNFKDKYSKFHLPCIQFPLLLTSYISLGHLSQLINWYWYVIIN